MDRDRAGGGRWLLRSHLARSYQKPNERKRLGNWFDAVKRCFDAYGADVARWPEEARERFGALALSDELAAVRREAVALDGFLGAATASEAVQPVYFGNLDLIPSARRLVGAEVELVGVKQREFQLKSALETTRENYDFILIDCPPSLGLLTVNALTAADSTLVPIQCEYYALQGLTDLLDTIGRVRTAVNPGLSVEGILLTMADERTNLSRQVEAEVRSHLEDLVFDTVIPRNVRLGEAPSFGKPIILYDVRSVGAQSYLSLMREVVRHGTEGARTGA